MKGLFGEEIGEDDLFGLWVEERLRWKEKQEEKDNDVMIHRFEAWSEDLFDE